MPSEVPQVPGCLPEGYGVNSLLTLRQFAKWKQISLTTVFRRWPRMPGRVQHSTHDKRVHVATYLAAVVKQK